MAKTPSSTSGRLEAFSDGVIAIAITLLVLDLGIPKTGEGELWDALWQQWPSYAAFIISFAVIGIMWVSHHAMFERIETVDRGLLFLNLALLMGIAFLPFPTSLLAAYVRDGGQDASIAAAIYSATMCLIGVVFYFMWVHLERHPQLLVEGITAEQLRRARAPVARRSDRVRTDDRCGLHQPVGVLRDLRPDRGLLRPRSVVTGGDPDRRANRRAGLTRLRR